MNPSEPVNPVPGTDPLVLIGILQAQIAANLVNASQVIQAGNLIGKPEAWRDVHRAIAEDTAAGHWGTVEWEASATGEIGTTNLHWLLAWMTGHPQAGSGFPPDYRPDGMAEIQILFQGQWYSAASVIAGSPKVPINQAGLQQIYSDPPTPPAFEPIEPAGNGIVTPPTAKDYVGAQFTAFAWHVTPIAYTVIGGLPNPDAVKIQGPGRFTTAVSPTGWFYYNSNPMDAGAAFWTSQPLS